MGLLLFLGALAAVLLYLHHDCENEARARKACAGREAQDESSGHRFD